MINLLDPSIVLETLYKSHKYDKMYAYCTDILAKSPDNMTALQNAALALVCLKRYEEAISYCDKVLYLREFDEYALRNKLLALEALDENENVIEICRHILKSNPHDTTALTAMGLALTKLKRYAESLPYYDKALDVSPDDTTALLNKGFSLTQLMRYEDVLSVYDRTYDIDSLSIDDKKNIALARSDIFTILKKDDCAFLAAQGVRDRDMAQIITDAQNNDCSVFHQFCDNEYSDILAQQNK